MVARGVKSTFVIPYKNLLQVFTCSLTNVVITLDPFSIFLCFVNEQPFPSTPYKGTKEFRICISLLEQLQLRFLFHIASSNLRYRIYFALISSRVSLFVSLCFGSKFTSNSNIHVDVSKFLFGKITLIVTESFHILVKFPHIISSLLPLLTSIHIS